MNSKRTIQNMSDLNDYQVIFYKIIILYRFIQIYTMKMFVIYKMYNIIKS